MTVKRHLVVFANAAGSGRGAVAYIAHRHGIELSKENTVSMICGEALSKTEGVQYVETGIPQYDSLRRFSHVIRELLIARRFKKEALALHAKKPIDVAIFHTQTGYAIAGSALQKAGCKSVIITHGDIFSRPKGTYDRLLTCLYRWATRRGYASCDRIQALSPFMRMQALQHGASECRVAVIPNGVDLPAGERPSPVPHDGLKLLYVGRIAVEKNLPALLKAVGIARQSDSQISLTVAGDGREFPRCKQLCREIGIEKDVVFLGYQNRECLSEIYRSHDVFCISSSDDPLPTVVLEAMSFGLPVIGTQVGGIPYMVDESCGITVPLGNADAFSDAVLHMRSAEVRLRFSRGATARVADVFSWDVIGQKLQAMVEEVSSEHCG